MHLRSLINPNTFLLLIFSRGPTLNTAYVLKKLKQLLEEPNGEGPLNVSAGELLLSDKDKFNETAAQMTHSYAM